MRSANHPPGRPLPCRKAPRGAALALLAALVTTLVAGPMASPSAQAQGRPQAPGGGRTNPAVTATAELPPGHALTLLPLADALVRRQGTGRRHVAVFADPYCPYCRQLEAELHKLPDLTIHTFVIPVLRAESASKSRSLWCAPDAVGAWQDWMLHGRSAPQAAPDCDHGALARNVVLAQRLGIRGTPALVFADGAIVVGGLSPEALARSVDAPVAPRR